MIDDFREALRQLTWRSVLRELGIASAMLVVFSVLFILLHLALRQELPRWY